MPTGTRRSISANSTTKPVIATSSGFIRGSLLKLTIESPLPLRERRGPIAQQWGGERLSVLSSGTCNLVSSVACFCVEPDQELVGEGDADDLLGFSRLAQPFVEGGEVGVVSADEIGDDEEDRADAVASAADGPFAEGLAAVASQRREAGEL